jgi:hypothetical protein
VLVSLQLKTSVGIYGKFLLGIQSSKTQIYKLTKKKREKSWSY